MQGYIDDMVPEHAGRKDARVLDKNGNSVTSNAITDMLTVWRRLHLECDRMGPPPQGEVFIESGEEKDVHPGLAGVVPVDLTLVRDQFLRAHVVAADDLGELNQIAVIPFVHNLSADMLDLKVTPYRSILSESSFWTVHVVSCYEAGTYESRDPNPVYALGRSYASACIFLETIRDLTEDDPPANVKSFSKVSKRITLHEILHRLLGSGHDYGIMVPDNNINEADSINVMVPYQIFKIRRLNKPL